MQGKHKGGNGRNGKRVTRDELITDICSIYICCAAYPGLGCMTGHLVSNKKLQFMPHLTDNLFRHFKHCKELISLTDRLQPQHLTVVTAWCWTPE